MNAIKKAGWVLVHEHTGMPVMDGDVVLDFRGEAETITGGRPPHKPSSGGFVWTADNREVYPSVFECKWVRESGGEDRPSSSYMSARESAIDEQAQMDDDYDDR